MLVLLAGLCLAAADGPDRAEYARLASDLHALAQRDAWVGVERKYHALEATGVPLSFRDHVAGAHAASARGDVAAARTRLQAAHRLREDRDIIEWMWSIDQAFGRVELAAEAGGERLDVDQMPFNPHEANAIGYASASLSAEGAWTGLLPGGSYRLDGHPFAVRPRAQGTLRVDARPEPRRSLLARLFKRLPPPSPYEVR